MKKIIDTLKNYGFSNEVIAAILGNIKVECDFKLKAEDMYYTKADTLVKTFPSKFTHMTSAEIISYTKNPEKLGNYVYKELGGYKYRGRGFIQITGISNYKAYGQLLKLDLVNNPDLLLREDIAILCTIEYIKQTAFKKYPSLNGIRDINTVADIITKSIQGFGKNYNIPFLKKTLEERRKKSNEYFKELEIEEILK